MGNSIRIGRLECDFLSWADFLAICSEWLQSGSLHHVVTLNPEMVLLAERDNDFFQAAARAELRVPDGSGLFWAKDFLAGSQRLPLSLLTFWRQKAPRLTGVEMVIKICGLASQKNKTVYLLGASLAERQGTARQLRHLFPGLKIFASAGQSESSGLAAHPDVLLVALGAPRQTLWIEQMRQSLPSVKIAIGVGGAFAMISGMTPRAPLVFRRLNLEWLWRLALEPSRLPRILNAVIFYPILVYKQKQKSFGNF